MGLAHALYIASAEEWVEQMAWLQPAHTLDARAPEMEALLLSDTFMLNAPTRIVPTHQNWCESADYTPFYRHLRKMLQFLQWQTHAEPGRRWILKSPPHLPNLSALTAVFPDATLVMTHRHPKTNVGSMLKLVELAQTRFAAAVDHDAIRDAWLRILTLNVERFLEFRDGNEGCFIDVGYPEVPGCKPGVFPLVRHGHDAHGVEMPPVLVADGPARLRRGPVGAVSVERIYAAAGAAFTEDTVNAANAWEADHPQNEGGAFDYDLADYGLAEADIEREFAEYIERFGSMF